MAEQDKGRSRGWTARDSSAKARAGTELGSVPAQVLLGQASGHWQTLPVQVPVLPWWSSQVPEALLPLIVPEASTTVVLPGA